MAETFEECQIPYTGTNPKTVPGGVGCDYYQVGLLGASYFLDQGRRRIGLMVGDSGDHVHEDAIRGYQAALARAGLSVQPERICCVKDLSEGGGYHGFRAWWPGAGRPEAVVVNDDILCRGAMQAALDLGIAIPERFQFASLAIKGSPLFFSRPFVRLEIDAAARARLLVQRLLEMIRQPGATPDPICLAPRAQGMRRKHWREPS